MCFGAAPIAAAAALAQAMASGFGACVVVGDGAPTVTAWMASANGMEIETLDRLAMGYVGHRWAEDWVSRHAEPEPIRMVEAVEALQPGMLVVVWR